MHNGTIHIRKKCSCFSYIILKNDKVKIFIIIHVHVYSITRSLTIVLLLNTVMYICIIIYM